jgi:hypothetical protein
MMLRDMPDIAMAVRTGAANRRCEIARPFAARNRAAPRRARRPHAKGPQRSYAALLKPDGTMKSAADIAKVFATAASIRAAGHHQLQLRRHSPF